MHRVTFILLFLILPGWCWADSSNLEVLIKKLNAHPQEDSVRSELLTDVAYALKGSNNLLAIKYLDAARVLGEKCNTTGFVGGRLLDLGECYTDLGNTEKALQLFKQAEKIFLARDNRKFIFLSLSKICQVYLSIKDYTHANEYLNKAFESIGNFKRNELLSNWYTMKAEILMQRKNYDSALVTLQRILTLAPQIKDGPEFDVSGLVYTTKSNIGLLHKIMNNYSLALKTFEELRFDSVFTKDPYYIAVIYNNLASTQAALGNYSKAKQYFDSAVPITIQNKYVFLEEENYKNMVDMYAKMKEPILENVYLKKYYKLKDSLYNTDKQNQLNQIEQNFTEEANQRALEEQQDKNKRNRTVALLLGLTALVITIVYFRTRHRSKLLALQKVEIEKQNLILKNLNQTKDKLFRIIGHDLRNPLVTLSRFINQQENKVRSAEDQLQLKKDTMQSLQETIGLLDNLLTWASAQLHQQPVTKHMIVLEDLLDDVRIQVQPQADQKQITLTLESQNPELQIISNKPMLSIVLRNILTNAIKFSYPKSSVQIQVVSMGKQTQIRIQDHGTGMSEEQIRSAMQGEAESSVGTQQEKGSGLGLNIVQDLLQKLGLRWTIESKIQVGTLVTIVYETEE